MVIVFEGVQKKIVLKSEEIKGPNINAPEVALEGFMRSNKIVKKELFKKKIEKGEFYFFKTKSQKLNTHDLLEHSVPLVLQEIQWKKSMKWGNFDLNWGRPLKSILAIFDKKKLIFNFHHLTSSNSTFIDKEFEEKRKIFNDYKDYNNFFKKINIIIDQNQRKNFIEKKNSKFNSVKFGELIMKNSNTQVIIVKNEIELSKYLRKNLISDEIIIGMGAGLISKWMRGLKNLL